MAIVSLYKNIKGVPARLDIGEPKHEGGEGRIYFSRDGLYAVKIYHDQRVTPQKRQFLDRIAELGKWLSPEQERFLCWPLALVNYVDGKPRTGCVTRRIPASYKPLANMNQSALAAKEQFLSGRLWSHYLQIARGVARAVAALNGMGSAHTDLSNRNFLVNPETCDVVLIDLDGLVVPGFLPAQVSGTWGFIAREVMMGESKPNELTDRHSLAVQVLQTLLFRNVFQPLKTYDVDQEKDEAIGWGEKLTFSEDPRDKCNRPSNLGIPLFNQGCLSYKMLTPALQKLTERACLDGVRQPNKRPSAKEWIDTLSYALDELYKCPRCRQHFPYPHWLSPPHRRQCPFCGQRIYQDLPSVLSLYEPRSRGKYVFVQRYLVMGDGWRLFADLLDPQRPPPMTRHGEPTVGHVQRDRRNNTNYLMNDEGKTWYARLPGEDSLTKVSRGVSLPLQPGTVIHFGEGRRLAVVSE